MALVPVICDSCGTLWAAPNVIGGGGGTIIHMEGNKVTPCPYCGGVGSIPDGVYSLVEDTLAAVSSVGATGPSLETLQSLIDLLTQERDAGTSAAEISQRVSEEHPEFAGVFAQLASKAEGSAGLAAWLAVIIMLLQWIVACSPDHDVNVTVNQTNTTTVIERVCDDLGRQPMPPPTRRPPQKPPD